VLLMTDLKTLGTFLFALSMGCGVDEAGAPGSLTVNASGEQASRDGFPVGEGDDEIAFADGWTLQFQHVVVAIADFSLRTVDGEDAALEAGPVVAELHSGEPDLWTFDGVPARRWDRVGFHYMPATEDARAANDVDEGVLQKMIDNGYSLYVAATAEKDGQEIELEYGFDFEIEHTRCVSGDETDGLVVPEGARVDAQITVHLDHLFFDTYAEDDAALRFDPMAAAAGDDGVVTLDDLSVQDNLSDLVDVDGEPLDLAYDPGSAFEPVPEDLREYVIAAATTTGHFNGEGHCDYERVDSRE
jgi:hypothetical protein